MLLLFLCNKIAILPSMIIFFLKKDKKSKKNDKKVLTNEKIFDILVLSMRKEKLT